MPKPTLIQSILGRPSQTYHHPPEHDYHSSRQELYKIANATHAIPGHWRDSGFDSTTPGNSDSEPPLSSLTPALRDRIHRRPSESRVSDAVGSDPSQSRRTPANKRVLIHSIASSSSFVSFNKNVDDNRRARSRTSSLNTSRQSHSSRNPSTSTKGNEGDIEDNSTDGIDDDDEGTDVFYTPRSSLLSSPRMSRVASSMLEPQALASALLPLHTSSVDRRSPLDDDTPPVSRTPSDTSISSTASSTSGGDSPSLFSVSPSASTRPTTATGSDRGSRRADDPVETVTIASSSRPRTLSSGAKSVGSSSPARSDASTVRKERDEEAEIRKLTYTDEDWAKDVRWLAPPKMPAAGATRNPRPIAANYQLPTDPHFSERRAAPSRSKGDRRSKRSRTSRGRMSALWEEDESEDCSTGLSSTEPSRSTTPIPETPPHSMPTSPLAKATMLRDDPQDEKTPSESTHSEGTPDARLQKYARGQRRSLSAVSPLFRPGGQNNGQAPKFSLPEPVPSTSSPSHINGYTGLSFAQTARTGTGKPAPNGHVDLVRSGVAQTTMVTIEVIRGVAANVSQSAPASMSGSSPKSRRPSFSFSLGRSFTLSLRGKKRESATPVHLQGSLPLPVAFTAHVAPPTYVPDSHVLVQVHAVGLDSLDSLIVHEKSGLSGSGGIGGGKGVGGGKAGFVPGRSFVGKVVECGWAVREEVCKRNEWVIGLLDVKKCGALAEFILVERHRVHRAPQPRSRGASPYPPRRLTHMRSNSLPVNGRVYPYSSSSLAPALLTIEELALLPLCGLPAYRAIRTFSDVLAPPLNSKPVSPTRPDVRALVLRAHDGPGALAVQMLGRRGIRICVQVPESAMLDGPEEPPQNGRKHPFDMVGRSSPSKIDKGKGREGQKPILSKRAQLEARLRAWGVEDICVGEAPDVLRQLAEDGQSFDIILDTVGGASIWEVSQRLLTMDWTVAASRSSLSLGSRNNSIDLGRDPAAASVDEDEVRSALNRSTTKSKSKTTITHAQFTTLVGDAPHRAIPTAQDNLRSGLRSLRRSMSTSTSASSPGGSSAAVLTRGGNKSQKRVVGYMWVSVATDVDFEGEDIRDSLGAIVRMAEAGVVRPLCVDAEGAPEGERVVPFERSPEVFRRGLVGPLGILADGGTCAIRIVG